MSRSTAKVILGEVLSTAIVRGHSGRVVTLSPPTSEAGIRFPARPQVGKLVVACYDLYSVESDVKCQTNK